jgi:hypothetical protein
MQASFGGKIGVHKQLWQLNVETFFYVFLLQVAKGSRKICKISPLSSRALPDNYNYLVEKGWSNLTVHSYGRIHPSIHPSIDMTGSKMVFTCL